MSSTDKSFHYTSASFQTNDTSDSTSYREVIALLMPSGTKADQVSKSVNGQPRNGGVDLISGGCSVEVRVEMHDSMLDIRTMLDHEDLNGAYSNIGHGVMHPAKIAGLAAIAKIKSAAPPGTRPFSTLVIPLKKQMKEVEVKPRVSFRLSVAVYPLFQTCHS